MRNVAKLALKKAQKIKDQNLCFLFVVNTKHKGIVLPKYIKKQYPEEITLVLQHQFANLNVEGNYFSVDLSFNGKIEKIVIPFSSLIVFSDQKAGIELRFDLAKDFELIEDEVYTYEIETDIDETSANINVDFSNNLINFRDIQKR